LDALEALEDQRNAVVLCGAQAIYLHTGEGDLAVSPYTTDADLALRPELLLNDPTLPQAMEAAGFDLTDQPGIWRNRSGLQVDLLVPEKLSGPGRRSAGLEPPHGSKSARKVKGLEASLVDNSSVAIESFETTDLRSYIILVAGPAALLVAKLHKIADRMDQGANRLKNKDALDVYRILQATPTEDLAESLRGLAVDPLAANVTATGVELLRSLFDHDQAEGIALLVDATFGLGDVENISASCVALADDLLRTMGAS